MNLMKTNHLMSLQVDNMQFPDGLLYDAKHYHNLNKPKCFRVVVSLMRYVAT